MKTNELPWKSMNSMEINGNQSMPWYGMEKAWASIAKQGNQ